METKSSRNKRQSKTNTRIPNKLPRTKQRKETNLKLKYVLIGDESAVSSTKNQKDCLLTGLWGWSRAISRYGNTGDVRLLRRKEDLEQYDIVHINLTSGNWALLDVISDTLKESSTVLMANIDFTVANWDNFPYFAMIKKMFSHVDIPFHTEPVGASALSNVLDRRIFCMPHPCDIECLDHHKKLDRKNYITSIHHRYHSMINCLWMAQINVPMHRVLLGYVKGNVPALPMFDYVFPYLPFMEAIDIMSRGRFGLDMFPFPVTGRAVIDFAALAVPCVCSNQIYSCRKLFPDLCIEPFDVKQANTLILDLLDDDEKYESVFKNAYYNVSFYGYKECYERLIRAFEEVKK